MKREPTTHPRIPKGKKTFSMTTEHTRNTAPPTHAKMPKPNTPHPSWFREEAAGLNTTGSLLSLFCRAWVSSLPSSGSPNHLWRLSGRKGRTMSTPPKTISKAKIISPDSIIYFEHTRAVEGNEGNGGWFHAERRRRIPETERRGLNTALCRGT